MKAIDPTHFERIPPFATEDDDRYVHAIVETPRDTPYKFAFEPRFGAFKVKALLAEGLQWPYDYGFIPGTLADDGDPIDILILNDRPTFAGCLIECRVLGLVRLKKDGVENDRIVAAPQQQPGIAQTADAYDDIDDVPKETIDGICRFLVEYSVDEGHTIEFDGVKSKKKALKAIADAVKAYEKRSR